jgi:hypothetical protein
MTLAYGSLARPPRAFRRMRSSTCLSRCGRVGPAHLPLTPLGGRASHDGAAVIDNVLRLQNMQKIGLKEWLC